MKVHEALARAIREEGVEDIFGVMGDGNISFWGALGRLGQVNIYSARHEAAAVAMADGFFRATGRVGVATITCGPGLTQIGSSLVAAARNRSAIVVMAGEIPTNDRNGIMTLDQRRFAEACEAKFRTITGPDNLADEIAEAFYLASSQSVPVVLNLPIDVQELAIDWEWSYQPARPHVPGNMTAAASDLDALADLLVQAERPIIIAGRDAKLSGAQDAIVDLADRSGALLATTLLGKGLFDGHPFNIGISGTYASAVGEQLFTDCDLVIGFGAEIGYYTSEGGLLFPGATVARVDTAPAPLALGVCPGPYFQGAAEATAAGLSKLLAERGVQKQGYRTEKTRALIDAPDQPFERATDGLDPRVLMQTVSESLPSDSRVVCGAGHFLGFVAMRLAVPSIDFSLQFGVIGQTLAVTIGMCVGRPGERHVVIEGDGSMMMHIQELDVAARHRLPITLIVLNDGGFGAEVHKLRAKGFDERLAQWPSPDFVGMARAMGGDGVVVETEAQVADALAQGLATDGLFLIDARISPTAVSDAYQKLHFGLPNTSPVLGRSRSAEAA